MKKFSLAAMVLAIMLVATSAMAHDVRVPVLIEFAKCDHEIIKTVTYEQRVNDNGSYDVSEITYIFQEDGMRGGCYCQHTWSKRVSYRDLSQTDFDDLFKESDNDYIAIKAHDGSVVRIFHHVYLDMGNKSYIAKRQ